MDTDKKQEMKKKKKDSPRKRLLKKRSLNWEDDETLRMVHQRIELAHLFKPGKIQSEGWEKVAQQMRGRTANQVKERWSAVKKLYAKEHKRRKQTGETDEDPATGGEAIICPKIYDVLETFLEDDPSMNLEVSQ